MWPQSIWILLSINFNYRYKQIRPMKVQTVQESSSSLSATCIIQRENPEQGESYSEGLSFSCKIHWLNYKLNISKPGFNNMWTVSLQMFKVVSEKAEEPEMKLPTSAGSSKKQGSSIKIAISALLTMPKPLNMWITINCGEFGKSSVPPDLPLEKSVCRSGSNI